MKMPGSTISSIEEVLGELDEIIFETKERNDTLGYFAVLYRRVTWKVKEGITTGYFEDPVRMEQLDIIFAQRYIHAYRDYRNGIPVTQSWQETFRLSQNRRLIILQHLLLGMNAHINLDLGIAAAEVCKYEDINTLQTDFYKINEILASLVDEVQHNLSVIWPPLRFILSKTGQLDNLLTDFSMQIARDGAWNFAKELCTIKETSLTECIAVRDAAVAKKTELIVNHKNTLSFLLKIIRLGERGTVAEKIEKMKNTEIN